MVIAAIMITPELVQDGAPLPQAPGRSEMIFSPWIKFCLESEEGKQICFTPERRGEALPRAYDGPPTDPAVFRAQQEKLQAELQKRAEDARKRLEEHEKKLRGEEPR